MANITVKELVRLLELHHPDAEISFEPMAFYRVKSRGERLVHFELNEILDFEDKGKIILAKSPGFRDT